MQRVRVWNQPSDWTLWALFLGINHRHARRGRQHVGCGQIVGFLKTAARDGSNTVAKGTNLGIRVAFPTSCPARAGRYELYES